jgi:hypothetical protein
MHQQEMNHGAEFSPPMDSFLEQDMEPKAFFPSCEGPPLDYPGGYVCTSVPKKITDWGYYPWLRLVAHVTRWDASWQAF